MPGSRRRPAPPRATSSTAIIFASGVFGTRTAPAFCLACRGVRASGGVPGSHRNSAPTQTPSLERCSASRPPRSRRCASRVHSDRNSFRMASVAVRSTKILVWSEREAFVKTPICCAMALAVAVLGCADGALAEQAKKLFFEGDLVRHTIENQKGPFCVLTSQFKRKEAVAWRIRVLDSTGAVADDKVLKSVVVELGDGQRLPAHY